MRGEILDYFNGDVKKAYKYHQSEKENALSENPQDFQRLNKKSPSIQPELDIDTLEYALYGEARELDEDEKMQLLELAKLMRKKRQEKQ